MERRERSESTYEINHFRRWKKFSFLALFDPPKRSKEKLLLLTRRSKVHIPVESGAKRSRNNALTMDHIHEILHCSWTHWNGPRTEIFFRFDLQKHVNMMNSRTLFLHIDFDQEPLVLQLSAVFLSSNLCRRKHLFFPYLSAVSRKVSSSFYKNPTYSTCHPTQFFPAFAEESFAARKLRLHLGRCIWSNSPCILNVARKRYRSQSRVRQVHKEDTLLRHLIAILQCMEYKRRFLVDHSEIIK